MFIDTHCHLDDPSLFDRLGEVLTNARTAGVDRIVVPAVGPGGWERIASLADPEKGIFPAFGLHPMLADEFSEEVLSYLENYSRNGAVAIGEIGLDYTSAVPAREKQLIAFRSQLRLAVSLGLPVLIHCRRAFHDLLEVMREEVVSRVGGVMHAFSGSPEMAGEFIKFGFAISVAGPVTYSNAVRPVELVMKIPLEHLVLETDAPDMTPEPLRGVSNEPAFLLETAKKVAGIKKVGLDELATVTTQKAERIFHFA